MREKIRAFVIDDDSGVRNVMSLLLKRKGYEVIEFHEALPCSACRNSPGKTCADLILCDVCMPGINGLEYVHNQMLIDCKCENIALMSANWSKADLEHAWKLGLQTFHKPFAWAELDDWLNQCERAINLDRTLADQVPGQDQGPAPA